jgi:MFS family permease
MKLTHERLPGPVRVLVATSFVVAVGYGIVAPALPTFASSFDVGVTAASAVVSAFAVFRIGFAPVAGRLVGRLGERWVFCGGLAVVAASSAACAFAAAYWQLLVFRAVGGIGSTMFTVSAAALLIRLTPAHQRGRATSSWAAGFLLGTVAGPLVGGTLIGVDVRLPFLAYATLLVLAVALGIAVLPGRTRASGKDRPAGVTFGAACRDRTFRAALSANFVYGWTAYGVWLALVPLYVVDILAEPAGWAGVVLAVSAGGTALALVVAGRLADVRGRKILVLIGLAVGIIGALLPALQTSPTTFLITAVLVGAGTGLVEAPTNAAVADVLGAGGRGTTSGTALAGFQMVGDVGAVIGPLLAGLVADTAGFGAAFALGAVLAAGCFAHWLRAPETAPRRLRTPD